MTGKIFLLKDIQKKKKELKTVTNKKSLLSLGFLRLSVIVRAVYKKNYQGVFFVLLYDILILELNIFNINRPRFFY